MRHCSPKCRQHNIPLKFYGNNYRSSYKGQEYVRDKIKATQKIPTQFLYLTHNTGNRNLLLEIGVPKLSMLPPKKAKYFCNYNTGLINRISICYLAKTVF